MSSSLVVSASAAVRASSSVARASASSKASARSNAKPPPTPRAVSSERVVAARAAVLGARVVARRARGAVVASAAADAMGGGAGDAAPDPYKALGVKPGADADEIKKALDRKKLLYKSEPEKLAKMEEAYESIVQASLAARLKGDLSGVDKKILNADAVSLFGPWAPIKCESVMKDKQVNVAIAAAATIITYMTPATVRNLQPIIYATIFMMFRMFAKLADVDPGPRCARRYFLSEKCNGRCRSVSFFSLHHIPFPSLSSLSSTSSCR